MTTLRPPRSVRWARGLVLLVTSALGFTLLSAPAQAAAPASTSTGTLDLFVQEGSIVQPGQPVTVRVTIRAQEAQPIAEQAVRLSLTSEPLATETALRRFLDRDADPALTVLDTRLSPAVRELESSDVRIPIVVPGDPAVPAQEPTSYGLQADFIPSIDEPDAEALLSQRQIVTIVPAGATIPSTPVAPIVSLTVPPVGGQPLSAAEVEAYTAPGGALDAVAGVLRRYPATVAVDSRITQSITALGDDAPESAVTWAADLGGLGFQQFALPWADADPLAVQAIDTLLYARLGQYPWLHNANVTRDQLESLAQRSASAILAPSSIVESDRTVVQYGSATLIRVDEELSTALRDAVLAATEGEAEAALQRVQGLVAKRAMSQTGEALVVDTGRLPVTAIALRLENILDRLNTIAYADIVGVPLGQEPSELAFDITESSQPREWNEFVDEVRELWQADVSYATIAANPEAVVVNRWNRYQALFSSAWLDNPVGADAEWERAQADSAVFQGSVYIEPGSSITVLADRTELPVTIRNELPSSVTVQLSVKPTRGLLRVEQSQISVVIPANSFQRVSVPVRSLANGVAPVELSLTNSLGDTLSEPVNLQVTIRAGWESVITIALAIIVGLVFAFGIYRAIQRQRQIGTSDG